MSFDLVFHEMGQKMPSFENFPLFSNDFPLFFANSAEINAYNSSSVEVFYAQPITKELIWILNRFKFQIIN